MQKSFCIPSSSSHEEHSAFERRECDEKRPATSWTDEMIMTKGFLIVAPVGGVSG